jgi:hypothetical protein
MVRFRNGAPGGLHVSVGPIFTFASDIPVGAVGWFVAAALSCAVRGCLVACCVSGVVSGRAAAVFVW